MRQSVINHDEVRRHRAAAGALLLALLAASCASHPPTEELIGLREGASVPAAVDAVLYRCQMWANTFELWSGGPADHVCAKAAPIDQSSDTIYERLPAGSAIKIKNALFINGIDATYLYFAASATAGGKKRDFFIEDRHAAKLLGVTLRDQS